MLCPKYAFTVEIYSRNEDTSLYRTFHQVPKVFSIEGFLK